MKQITQLKINKLGAKLWMLTASLTFESNLGFKFVVPSGFYTDGASNIRALWSLCPPMSGLTAEPAVLHDFLYSKDCKWKFTRKEADDIFLEAMLNAGVNKVRAYAVYAGVRAGGAGSFQKQYSFAKATEVSISVLTSYIRSH